MWKWRYLWQGTGLCTVHLWVVTGQANSFRHSGCWVYSVGSRNCLSRFTRWWRQLPVLYRQFVAHCHGKLFWWSCVQQVLQSIEVDFKTNNIGHLCNKLYFLLKIILNTEINHTELFIQFMTNNFFLKFMFLLETDCTFTNLIITSYGVKADSHLINQQKIM